MVNEYTLVEDDRLTDLIKESWFSKESIPNGNQSNSYFVPTHRLLNTAEEIAIPKGDFKTLLSDLLIMSLQSESPKDSQRFTEIKNRLFSYMVEQKTTSQKGK